MCIRDSSTSGSTGSPKLVMLTHKNLAVNTESIVAYLGLRQDDCAISNLPLYYSYGMSVVNTHLAVGARLVLTTSSIVSREFWAAFNEHQVTSFSGVPYHYEILDKIRFMRMTLPSLRMLTQAGGKLSAVLVEKFASYSRSQQAEFFVMYGQTEASPRIAYLPPDKVLEKPGSIGVPVPGGQLSLVDEAGQIINEANVDGELIYHGDNVMLGYATSRSELALGDRCRHELHTGDIASRDSDGFYFIHGRKKRFLKLQGNRFSLDRLEQNLKASGLACVCGGVDDCLIILTTDAAAVGQVADVLKKAYKLHHSVYKIVCVNEFPVSTSGKIRYQAFQEYV